MRYGNYELQPGDDDATQTYGGARRTGPARATVATADAGSTAVNTLAVPHYVRTLQEDLGLLGFRYAPDPATGQFDLNTEFAVREFQIYARFGRAAQEMMVQPATTPYVDRLAGISNSQPSTSEVTGILDAGTRTALQHWLDNNYRCPVIVQARNGPGFSNLVQDNLWAFDSMTNSAPRVFVRDFSDRYTMPVPSDPRNVAINGHEYLVLGYYDTQGGPNILAANHSWDVADMSPQALYGTNAMTAAEQSTFMVIMPTAQAECGQRFDVINAWDNSYLSVPVYHHTLGRRTAGELPALLSYVRHHDAAAFQAAVGFAGIRGSQTWPIAMVQGAYGTTIAQIRSLGGGFVDVPRTDANYSYFRGWHWLYRFAMAGRSMPGYRDSVWEFARLRLTNLHGADFGQNVGGQSTTVGAVFTSEYAMGMLLRWHVWRPGHILTAGNRAETRLHRVLSNAQAAASSLDWTTLPATWTDPHEDALIEALRAETLTVAGLVPRMQFVHNYAFQGNGLSRTRNSFQALP